MDTQVDPTSSSSQPPDPAKPSVRPARVRREARNRRRKLALLAASLVCLLIAAVIVLSNGDDGDGARAPPLASFWRHHGNV